MIIVAYLLREEKLKKSKTKPINKDHFLQYSRIIFYFFLFSISFWFLLE